MSEYNKTILTNAGLELATKANKGQAKFTITKAATSVDHYEDLSINELQELDDLPSIMQYGTINDVTDAAQDSNTVIGTELVFNNKDLVRSYNINAVGLYAKEEGQDKEILYAISTAVTPEVMPSYKNKTLFKFTMTMFVVIGKTENVSVSVTDNGAVTQKQLDKVVSNLPTKMDIQSLAALNSTTKSIANTKVDLDSYGYMGITKFTNCQLQSTGQMVGLNKDATNLSGWIFNVPNQIDEAPYQQIVYINDYGNGTQTYVRLRSDVSSTKQEDFEKVTTDRDMARLLNLTQDGVYKAFRSTTVNPNEITDTGIYLLSSCTLAVKATNNDLSSRYWGWLINLNYENTTTSNAIYQILIVNEVVYYRIISAQYKKYPPFDNIAYGSDIAKLQQAINNVDFSSLETKADAKTAHDELNSEILKRGKVFSVNGYLPGAGGTIYLPNFENPNYTYAKNQSFDVDQAKTPGIYSFSDSKLTASIRTDALDGLPRTTDGTTMFGYLVVLKHDIWNIDQFLFLNTGMETPDLVVATRSISGANNFRPKFRRLLNTDDAVHHCDDLASGIEYSKANPNCIVATP